jgi:hypothetical protein
MQPTRRLTVGYTSRRSKLRITRRDARSNIVRESVKPVYSACPALKISGDWLAEAGFHVGDIVRVEISRGQLIIHTEGSQI